MEENKRIHVQHYYSETPSATPIPEDVQYGEIAVNNADEKMFIKNTTGNIASFSSDEKLIEKIESSLSDYATVDYVDSAFSKVVNDDSLLKVVDENNNVNKTNLKIGNVEIQSGEVSYALYIEQLNMNDATYDGIVAEFTGEYREYEWKDGEDADPSNNKGVAMVFRPTEYTNENDNSFVDELFVQIHGWDDANTTNNISVYAAWAIWDEYYETEIQWMEGVRLVRSFIQVADSELTSKLLVNDVPVAVVTDLPKLPEGILTVDNEGNLNKTKLKMSYDFWYEGEEGSTLWDKGNILDVSKESTTISATQNEDEELSGNSVRTAATLSLNGGGATLSFYEYENGSAFLTVKNDGAYITSEDYMGEEGKILTENDLDGINNSIVNSLKDYYNKEHIDANFQPKGEYATEKWVKDQGYITLSDIPEADYKEYDDTEIRSLITTAHNDLIAHTGDGDIHVTLQQKIDWQNATNAINAFLDESATPDNVINTLVEIREYLNGEDGSVEALLDKVDAIAADYLKGADKTELEGKITAAQSAAEKVATDFNTAMNGRMTTVEGKVDELKAIDHDAYKSADENLKNELLAKIGNANVKFKNVLGSLPWEGMSENPVSIIGEQYDEGDLILISQYDELTGNPRLDLGCEAYLLVYYDNYNHDTGYEWINISKSSSTNNEIDIDKYLEDYYKKSEVNTLFNKFKNSIALLNSKIVKLEEYVTSLSNLVESYHGETPGCTDPTDGDDYPGPVACDCAVDDLDEACTEFEGHIDCNCAEDEGDCQIPGEGGDSIPSGCNFPGLDDGCYMLGEVDETPCDEGGEMDYPVCECGEEGDNGGCDSNEQDEDCIASSGEEDNTPQCECPEDGDDEPSCECGEEDASY